MTVSTTTSRADYAANGVTTVFAVPFYFLANTDLNVLLTLPDGTVVPRVLGTDYTASGAGNESGGAIAFLGTPLIGQKVSILRAVPATQETHYVENDPFPADAHEQALDKLTMLAQQTLEVVDRALVFPENETVSVTIPSVAARAGMLLGFDLNGSPVALVPGAPDAAATAAVSGVAAALVAAQLATASGAAGVGFKQPGIGAVERTLADKLQELVSVKDYGALGDNSTDDTAAILRTVVAVKLAGFGRVFFPPGIYRVTGLVIDGTSIELVGTTDSYISCISTTQWAVDFNGASVNNQNQISNLGVICAVAGQDPSVGAVRFLNQGNITIDRLRISNLGGHQFANGLKLENFSTARVSNTDLFNTSTGSFWANQGGGLTLINTLTSGDGFGYLMDGIDGMWGFNAYTAQQGGTGWQIRRTGTKLNDNWFLFGCGADDSVGYNWQITQMLRLSAYGLWGATSSGSNAAASGMILSGSAVQGVELHAPFLSNNNKAGLEVIDAIGVKIVGGMFQNNGNSGSGSGIQASGTADVQIIGATSNDTRGTPMQEYGVSIAGNATVRVSDCDLRGNRLGPLISTAAPTTATRYHDNLGFDPEGLYLTPPFPASGVTVTNTTGLTARVIYGSSGAITSVSLNGGVTGLSGNGMIVLGQGETISLTYSGTGFWGWYGL